MRIVGSVVLCFILLLVAPVSRAIEPAGNVERLQGTATATSTANLTRTLQEGSTVLVGDRIATGTASRVRLRFNDGGSITLGDNTTLTIQTYDTDSPASRGLLDVAEGVFLAVTGAIARLGPDRYIVTTPVATLGIRGTEVWGSQLPGRFAVTMLSGTGVVVTTPQGTVELAEPLSGVDIVEGEALPAPRQWSAERLERSRQEVAFQGE